MPVKVLIGMPVGGTVEPGMIESYADAVALHPSEGYASPLKIVPYRVTNHARNTLAAELLKGDWTHLFMLDDDMIYPPFTLARLIQADKDIIAPFYVRKVRGFLPNAFIDTPEGRRTVWVDDLRRVAACGTGGMLIKRKVFETLEPPWFEYEPYGTSYNDLLEQKSEDVVFCDKASRAGFEIWVDGRIKCGHIGTFVVTPGREIEGKPGFGSVDISPYERKDRIEDDYGY